MRKALVGLNGARRLSGLNACFFTNEALRSEKHSFMGKNNRTCGNLAWSANDLAGALRVGNLWGNQRHTPLKGEPTPVPRSLVDTNLAAIRSVTSAFQLIGLA